MNRLLSSIFFLSFLTGYAYAQADVFLCVDESGKKEYKNTGTTKGCKKVELPGINIIPAPTPTVKRAASSPSDFPKVDNSTQKARDADRKQILLDELRAEERKLASLKKEYNNGEPERQGGEKNYAKYEERTKLMKEDLNRTEKNIEALNREVGNLK
jgi:hypothetical protein